MNAVTLQKKLFGNLYMHTTKFVALKLLAPKVKMR